MKEAKGPEPTLGLRRYSPYPKYKGSGVEWLGEVPAHWETLRMKLAAKVNPPRTSLPRVPADLPVSFHAMDAVGNGILLQGVEKPIGEIGGSYTSFIDGDVLIAKITPSFENGKGALARGLTNGIGFGTTELHVIRPCLGTEAAYAYYATLAHSFRHPGTGMMQGTAGQQRVPDDFLINYRLPKPPLAEQRAIAAFLDRETAKIAVVVATKERLIELLQENRTSLISQAVTKGLDPRTPMKDSGVEWLGEMPAHWEVRRLKILADVRMSNVDKKSVQGQVAVALCNYTDVYYHERITPEIEFMQATATEDQVKRFGLLAHDVLITKDSEIWTDIAVPALVVEDLDGVLCGYHLALARPLPGKVDGGFLARAFAAIGPRDQFQIVANGITRYGLSSDAIRTGVFAIPPVEEQRAIAALLDRETAKIDALVAKVREGIERLKEYRTALISAAVTGRIDVRGIATPADP